jgi:hypothetical protein
MRKLWTISGALAFCAILGIAARPSLAATIVKLNLGSSSPNINLDAAGVLSTFNDANSATTGDHNTTVDFTGFLDAEYTDIHSPIASFTLSGLATSAPTTIINSLVIQNFSGGTMALYDPTNTLLLQGALGVSAMTGTLTGFLGAGDGGLFTTTFSNVTGGTLAEEVAANTLVVSMNFSGASTAGLPGFAVSPTTGRLLPFQTGAAVSIKASENIIPEPAGLVLLLVGGAAVAVTARRTSAFLG